MADRMVITAAVKLAMSEIGVIPNGKEISIVVNHIMDAIDGKVDKVDKVSTVSSGPSPALLEQMKAIKAK